MLNKNKLSRTAGFTLVELLVVIGIIMLMVSIAVTVSGYVTEAAKIRNTKGTIGMLVASLQAFKEYEDRGSGNFNYPPSPYTNGTLYEVELSGFGTVVRNGHETIIPEEWEGLNDADLWDAQASIEVLYFYLDDIPASREVLNKLSGSVTANADGDYVAMGNDKGLIEVIDGWKLPLRYETRGGGNFPLIRSAGPDGVYATADDILSSEL